MLDPIIVCHAGQRRSFPCRREVMAKFFSQYTSILRAPFMEILID
jgi:hypothetical protein